MEPNLDLSNVSGLYGPGAYWAWVMGTTSALIGAVSDSEEVVQKFPFVSLDFVISMLYVIATSFDFLRRAYLISLGEQLVRADVECQAAMHVCYMALPFLIIAITVSNRTLRHIWTAAYLLGGAYAVPMIWGALDKKPGDYEYWFEGLYSVWQLLAYAILIPIDQAPPRVKRIFIPVFLFLHLCIFEYSERRPRSFAPISFFTPISGSKITDLDQAVSLISAAFALAFQWWRYPRRLFQKKRPEPVRSTSLLVESGGEPPVDDYSPDAYVAEWKRIEELETLQNF